MLKVLTGECDPIADCAGDWGVRDDADDVELESYGVEGRERHECVYW